MKISSKLVMLKKNDHVVGNNKNAQRSETDRRQ